MFLEFVTCRMSLTWGSDFILAFVKINLFAFFYRAKIDSIVDIITIDSAS